MDTSDHINLSDLKVNADKPDLWLKNPPKYKITQIHINDKQTADFQTIINKRQVSTLWNPGDFQICYKWIFSWKITKHRQNRTMHK